MALARLMLVAVWMIGFAALAVPIGLLGTDSLVAGMLMRVFCRGLLRLIGIGVTTSGNIDGRAQGGLLVANHVSWIDILVLGSREPLCFLAKSEVGRWPVIARLARSQGTVFVDRGRRSTIPAANAAMAHRISGQKTVVLFPEGTTHDGIHRGVFRTSHLACLRNLLSQSPGLEHGVVQPAGLIYSSKLAAWVGDAALLPHLWAVLRSGGIACHVAYGDSIAVERGFDRKRLGKDLAERVEALVLGHCFEPDAVPRRLAVQPVTSKAITP